MEWKLKTASWPASYIGKEAHQSKKGFASVYVKWSCDADWKQAKPDALFHGGVYKGQGRNQCKLITCVY